MRRRQATLPITRRSSKMSVSDFVLEWASSFQEFLTTGRLTRLTTQAHTNHMVQIKSQPSPPLQEPLDSASGG